jgi:hypothetical protein
MEPERGGSAPASRLLAGGPGGEPFVEVPVDGVASAPAQPYCACTFRTEGNGTGIWLKKRQNYNIKLAVRSSVVDPDPQGSGTFAGSVTQVHIRKWMLTKLTKTIKSFLNFDHFYILNLNIL